MSMACGIWRNDVRGHRQVPREPQVMGTAAEFNTADWSLRNRAVREMVMKARTVPHATMTDEEWELMSVLPERATLMGPRHSPTQEQILERKRFEKPSPKTIRKAMR